MGIYYDTDADAVDDDDYDGCDGYGVSDGDINKDDNSTQIDNFGRIYLFFYSFLSFTFFHFYLAKRLDNHTSYWGLKTTTHMAKIISTLA